jgi:hypothetical protein
MPNDSPRQVEISLRTSKGAADKIAMLVQRGFLVPIDGPVAIEELLTTLPGFSRAYIRDRVQTIFVNGLAEDDTGRRLLPGDTLALSAAMPGLAGAIFRRGGRHGSLRTRPQHQDNQTVSKPGYITIKLFNMIATETGPRILRQGILIQGTVLVRFLDRQGERILPLIKTVQIDGRKTDAKATGEKITADATILLRIDG